MLLKLVRLLFTAWRFWVWIWQTINLALSWISQIIISFTYNRTVIKVTCRDLVVISLSQWYFILVPLWFGLLLRSISYLFSSRFVFPRHCWVHLITANLYPYACCLPGSCFILFHFYSLTVLCNTSCTIYAMWFSYRFSMNTLNSHPPHWPFGAWVYSLWHAELRLKQLSVSIIYF